MVFQIFSRVFLLSFVFTTCLFVYEHVFLSIDVSLEEAYIEPTLSDVDIVDIPEIFPGEDEQVSEEGGEEISSAPEIPIGSLEEVSIPSSELLSDTRITFVYVPENFREETLSYTQLSQGFLSSGSVRDKIETLNVEFYKILVDVRGRMKQRTVKLWGVTEMTESEFLSVFIHELSHYLDLYFFSDSVFGDVSQRFYDISWQSTTIVKKGQIPANFVSGYATTNKYEDFAESLTYYILHNRDFLIKAQKDPILQQKYDFFVNELFLTGAFQGTDFSRNNVIKDYYWDITKIDTETENFLQYLENEI